MSQEQRIIDLQRQVSLARRALIKIANGHVRQPERTAEATLNEMMRLDPKQQLQGIVGHRMLPERNRYSRG